MRGDGRAVRPARQAHSVPPRRLSYPGAVRLPRLSPSAFRTLVLVTLVSLVVITVVGAGVRLTESGLGCSTWPRCEPDSFTPRSASDVNAMVEFANRMLNAVVGLLSVATVVGALRRQPRRADLVRWSWGVFAWVASNGIVGAFVVWLHLSPVSVIGHFALALGAIWNALVLYQRAGEADGAGERRRVDATDRFVALAKVQLAAAVVVLFTGTLVTGSGPHAGDDRADRLDLTVGTIARVHGLSMVVFLLVTLPTLSRIAVASAILLSTTVSAQTIVNPQPVATAHAQNVTVVPQVATDNILRAGRRRFPLRFPSISRPRARSLKSARWCSSRSPRTSCSTDASSFRRARRSKGAYRSPQQGHVGQVG